MIKYFMILILLLLELNVTGQLNDDFMDGDFTRNPKWIGDTGKFEVNTASQLHLIALGADLSALVTANSILERTEWSFWMKLSFNTSTNNYARVYLVSDNADLKGPVNGYFLQIGGSNDSISFFKQTGTHIEKLFKANFCCTNHPTNVLRLKMIHDSLGMWTLYADNTGGMNFLEEGHCTDPGILSTSWFGIYCQYTTSNSTKFFFDDFYVGIIQTDTICQVKTWDVIMDEIMADPDPVTGLPESEYVELYNRTLFPLNLSGWTFEYGSSIKTFPGISIEPHGYLILTNDTVMNNYGPCTFLFSSSSSLANEGATLVLKNSSGKVIHSVTYSSDWYQDALKENGGWSLEMIDPGNPCGCKDNWRASKDVKGGTPGAINSVHASQPDNIQPYLKMAWIISDSIVETEFSESMDSLSLNDENQWYLDEDGFTPIKVSLIPPGYNSVYLTLPESLEKNQIYSLSCKNPPTDCVGNYLDTARKVRTGLPDSIFPGDLIINEILANPATNGAKFIEIFNRSEKILNLQELALGLFDSTQNMGCDLKSISESGLLSFPGDFSVLTKNPDDIMNRYYCPDPDVFIKMASLPSINSDNGIVVLARKNDGIIIDRVKYSTEMYSDLLTSTDGVSLERINPSFSSEDITNWHSASESCGFATPGYKNSEFLKMDPGKDAVSLSPFVFTPDNDGKDDVLMIRFTLDSPDYFVNITIFDAKGSRIRNLVKNRMLSSEDGIIWDGRDDNNKKSPIGIYILSIELIKSEGKVSHLKKTCVLGGSR
jgi:hypothetical protein